jgi:hypothetical protein
MWNKQTVLCLWSYASVTLLYEKKVIFCVKNINKDTKAQFFPLKTLKCTKLPTLAQI